MENFSASLFETVSSALVRRAVNNMYSALFEGLTPQQKTRRDLRNILPEPPGGWAAPAVDEEGNRLHTIENGRPMNFAECLEYNIRNSFFHNGGRTNPKFEPGVARIAYTELGLWPQNLVDWKDRKSTPNWNKIREFASILKNISTSHADDYDPTLNGMSFDELSARFAHGSAPSETVNETADGTGCRYDVRWIPNFQTAREYAKYTEGTQAWCLTTDRSQWNHYMKGGTVKMYICTMPGFENVPGEPGPNCPLDEYGLSMLGVSVNPDGSLDTCCSRWNHLHGGSDMVMDEAELCKVLNVRKLSDVCPPYTKEEIENRANRVMSEIMAKVHAILDKNNPMDMSANFFFFDVKDQSVPGYRLLELHAGREPANCRVVCLVLNDKMEPMFKYPLVECRLFGGSGNPASICGRYDPDIDSLEALMEPPPANLDITEMPMVVGSFISGKTFYSLENDIDCSYCTIDDVIDRPDPKYSYSYSDDELNRGILLDIHEAWTGDVLLDTVKMKFVNELDDSFIDGHVGNMTCKGGKIYFVSKNGVIDYGKVLRKGKKYFNADICSSRNYRNIGIDLFTGSIWDRSGIASKSQMSLVSDTRKLFIVNPITGKVIREFNSVDSYELVEMDGNEMFEITTADGKILHCDFDGNLRD